MRVPAGEEEPAEQGLRVRPRQPRRPLCALEHAAALVEVDRVLREVRGLDAMAEPRAAGDGFATSEHRLEQARLPGAVRADKRHVLAALEREVDVGEQHALAGGDRESFDVDDDPAAPRRFQEGEAEMLAALREPLTLVGRLRALLLEPADLRQLRLRLLGLCLLVPESLDEPLEPHDVLADASLGLRCVLRARSLLESPRVPWAGEVD